VQWRSASSCDHGNEPSGFVEGEDGVSYSRGGGPPPFGF